MQAYTSRATEVNQNFRQTYFQGHRYFAAINTLIEIRQ